ncbi:MAG: hypothetical protein KatS3mg105_3761 [Gemmatales bacterium]|nr:MAG: hypothetical protein KatS3mg105_3761 [Gemmatales bacterium]
MKPTSARWLFLFAALIAWGCQSGVPDAASQEQALSIGEWKSMPIDEKYTPETLERLKRSHPTLETPEGWKAFERSTLKPERKEDFGN